MDFSAKRLKQKQNFNKAVHDIWNNALYQDGFEYQIKILGYSVQQISEQHKHELLNIICYQFSSMGGTNTDKTVMTSVKDLIYKCEVDINHIVTTGLGYVILDKYNHIVLFDFGMDYTDQPEYDENQLPSKLKKKTYIYNTAYKKDKMLQKYIFNKNINYGEIFHHYTFGIRPDLIGNKLIRMGIMVQILSRLNYKYGFAEQTSPKSIKFSGLLSKIYPFNKWLHQSSVFNFNNIIFNGIDNSSLNNEYYQQLENKYKFKDIQDLRTKNSKISIIFYDIGKIPDDFWTIAARFNKKTRSASKL